MSKYRFPALNSLIAFEAAARRQSIKDAAAELHVTHGAVSRHIQKLEREVGRRLFDRHHQRVALTDDGKIFFDAVGRGFSHIQRGVDQLRGNQSPGRLVISVDPDFAALWLVPRLAGFYALLPQVFVEILAENNLRSLEDPRIDCAIQYAPAGAELENGEFLFRSRLFPVCAPGAMRTLPLRSSEDFRYQTLLHDRSIAEWQEYLRRYPSSVDIELRSGVAFSETALCLDAAARGQGVAIGDDFLAAMYLSEGRLVRPFDSEFFSKNAYYFLSPERSAQHPAVTAFRTWLFQTLELSRRI